MIVFSPSTILSQDTSEAPCLAGRIHHNKAFHPPDDDGRLSVIARFMLLQNVSRRTAMTSEEKTTSDHSRTISPRFIVPAAGMSLVPFVVVSASVGWFSSADYNITREGQRTLL